MNYKELETQFLNRRISRREFLAGAAALGAVSLASTLPSGVALADEPRRGGTLRVGIGHGSTGDSLDPGLMNNDHLLAIARANHNHLGELNAAGEIEPELAESWETDDARTWVIKLRREVEFHNGQKVKADDVIASFRHHMDEDSGSAVHSLLQQIEEIRKDNDQTVVFRLEAPNAAFMYVASAYHIVIKPAVGNGEIDPTDGIGAGPFTLESFEAGESAELKRFDGYWKEGRPYFDGLRLLSIHDQSARTNALMADELDLIDSADLATVDRLGEVAGVRVENVEGLQHYSFAMRTDQAPFDDNHVRMALKLGIDRQQIVDTILRGYGHVGNDHPISPRNRFFADQLEQREYDPEQARWHLQQAGAEGLQVSLSASDAAFVGAVEAATLFRETARDAGIDLEIVREPSDGYWSDVWMNKPFSAVYWAGRPSEDWVLSTTYLSGADWNDTFWENEEFDRLVRDARAELYDDVRAEKYAEAQRLLRDEGGALIPAFANYVFAMRDRVRHDGNLAGDWGLDGMKFSERWWFA